jgi:hypothetical protein
MLSLQCRFNFFFSGSECFVSTLVDDIINISKLCQKIFLISKKLCIDSISVETKRNQTKLIHVKLKVKSE